ncbi:MAG: hypothetical protein EA376_10265 [Phycisphaeraceae bacterium]|nr:MAG: hypothetical protein EA376_10265 [Phycisphaeraceae bacterium]
MPPKEETPPQVDDATRDSEAEELPLLDEVVSDGKRRPSLRELWQIPVLLLAVGLLAAGIYTARMSQPGHDFDGALADVEALIEREDFDSALQILNSLILPHLDDPEATVADRRNFHLLRGDALYHGQRAMRLDNPANHQAVLNEYDAAETLMAKLDPVRIGAYADSLVSLGRHESALERIRQIPDSQSDRRRALMRRIIERNLQEAPESRYESTLNLLSELAADEGISGSDRLWIVARQAELRIAMGYYEEAFTHLLRAIQRTGELEGPGGAELFILLARSYFELGRLEQASRHLERADEMLTPSDSRRAESLTLRGRIEQIRGEPQEARDRFTVVVAEFPNAPAALRAWLGLAEVESIIGNVDASQEAYEQVIVRARREPARRDVTLRMITDSLLRQQQERHLRGDHENALAFARLAERLHGADLAPADVLRAIAVTHRSLAEELVDPAQPDPERPPDLSLLDPVTRAEGRAHFAEAGAYFLRHARLVLLHDDDAFADSLWLSGDSYDRAGEMDRAIEIFSEYATGRPDDPRQPSAYFRLAQAHMARGDYPIAAGFFRDLIQSNPTSGEGTRSYVPLAQCYLLEGREGAEEEAERLLLAIVDGSILAPDAIEFRDALFELGRLYLRADRLEDAIRRLTEAMERFPDDPEIVRVEYSLAESLRRSAHRIGLTLREAMPESRRRTLQSEREGRLSKAMDLYERVWSTLDSRDERRLSRLERIQKRNSLFYRADCAYDLEDYESAIKLYDAAAQRYAEDPASLVAMIQIVNAYVAQQAWREALTANERARQRLAELPEEALDSPDTPLDARHMERWLESTAILSRRAAVPR